eukprot:IDg6813t1
MAPISQPGPVSSRNNSTGQDHKKRKKPKKKNGKAARRTSDSPPPIPVDLTKIFDESLSLPVANRYGNVNTEPSSFKDEFEAHRLLQDARYVGANLSESEAFLMIKKFLIGKTRASTIV